MYYIYEIEGVKVGCTQDMERRQREQRDKGKMVLLEFTTCIEEATRRERELQRIKGYKVDSHGYSKQLILVEKAKDPKIVKKRTLNTDYKAIHEKGAPKRKKYYDSFRRYNDSKMRPIEQFSLQGKFLNSYNSIAEGGRQNNIPKSYIGDSLRGRQHTAGGYIWKYA